jgi:magnesium chelatase subunit D
MVSTFPFSAVVGMDEMRLALILNAISPRIGGVLVRGEKGTAKSTAVRGLAEVLPTVEVVRGCRFNCDPHAPFPACPDGPHAGDVPGEPRRGMLYELPIGATEDRLVGSLDLERALTEGVKSFEPGLLATANRGLLYVDEINLLHDHLVDLLLDAAALGVSYVERDGVSVQHAASFQLVGTMNPEEGELRPQLLDRFGLTVEVRAPRDPAMRAEVVRRRMTFDADPDRFVDRARADTAALAARIATARTLLPAVRLDDAMLERIGRVCTAFDVDGLRADIVMARASSAHAAWQGRDRVGLDDIRIAAQLALPHRRRRDPFDAPGLDESLLDEALGNDAEEPPDPDGAGPGGSPGEDRATPPRESTDSTSSAESTGCTGSAAMNSATQVIATGNPFRTNRLEVPGIGAGTPGRRSRAVTEIGQATRAIVPEGRVRSLHLVATLMAAAPHQRQRGRRGPGLVLESADLREAVLEGRESNLLLFVVDASGSMAARRRMTAVKSAVLSLLLDAYQRRDKVGLITFRGSGAQLALPPTSSVYAAAARLRQLPSGGRTPLADGLVLAHQVAARERLRDPGRRPLLVLVTDGRANHGQGADRAADALARTGIAGVVVDCEAGRIRLGLAAELAGRLGAGLIRLEDLGGRHTGTDLAASITQFRSVA